LIQQEFQGEGQRKKVGDVEEGHKFKSKIKYLKK